MNYTLKDLLDVPRLRELLDSLDEIHSLPSAIIDIEGNILTATAWQDICTLFHRVNPDTEKKCIESDTHIIAELENNMRHIIYRCPMGLVDAAMPIIIDGKHLGNVFTGQLFMEPPDEEYFINQAQQYGFDVSEYLAAMRRVPIFPEEKLRKHLAFIHSLAQMLAEQGLQYKRQCEAENALQEREELYRDLFARAGEGIIILSPEGRLIEVNESFARMHGYSSLEMQTMELKDLDTPETFRLAPGRMRRLLAGEALTFEVEHYHKDGHVFPLEVSASLISSGGNSYFQSFHRDITERKKMDDALIKSEKRLKEAQHIANIGNWELDLVNNTLVWSDEIYRIFEIDPTMFGATYESFLETIHPDDREAVNGAYFESLKDKKPYEIMHRLLMNDSRVKYVLERCETYFDADGQPQRSIGTVQDITKVRLAEEERVHLEAQLFHAQKMESVGRLAGGVAHDFNNMLTVILGYASLSLSKPDLPPSLHENLEEIRKAAEQSAVLTRQLLAFARKQIIDPKVLDLNDTVAGMLKMLQRLIGEDINLMWHPAPDPWLLKFDPSQIDQILANLCVNARDSIAADGNITIETKNCRLDEHDCFVPGEYEYVLLSVSDNGCGMDKETQSRIFEPFFTTKEVGKGTGLGLATVFGIVKQNNGFINVYSEPGLGTTFRIYLPRHVGKVEQTQTRVATMQIPRGLETILLVEDDLPILNMTAMILAKQGYTILKANTPTEAIRLAKEHVDEISMLITDVIMPEMNGKELISNLEFTSPQLKCLFMSGYTADAIAQHGVLEEGINFIQKPFSLPDLAVKVREVLDGK